MCTKREIHTCLGAGHQVSFGLDDGDSIFLNRGGASVATQVDVPHDNLPQFHIMELKNKQTISKGIRIKVQMN